MVSEKESIWQAFNLLFRCHGELHTTSGSRTLLLLKKKKKKWVLWNLHDSASSIEQRTLENKRANGVPSYTVGRQPCQVVPVTFLVPKSRTSVSKQNELKSLNSQVSSYSPVGAPHKIKPTKSDHLFFMAEPLITDHGSTGAKLESTRWPARTCWI